MAEKRPTSFKIFLGVIMVTVLVFVAATLFSYYHVDRKYSMILAFFLFVTLAFTTVGVYAGFKYNSDTTRARLQNRIGLVGNLLIFLFIVSMMAFAAIMKAH